MEALHVPPDDSTATKQIKRKIPEGTMTVYAYQPEGPRELTAHAAGGEYAHGMSSRYEIDWRDARGNLIRHVSQPLLKGPPLSAEERKSADEQIENFVKRLGVSRLDLGFSVPDNKQPLSDLFFDQAGNLWVVLSTTRGAPRRADVWDAEGNLVRSVTWPNAVSLDYGVIAGSGLWGIARDSLGVQVPVRLTPAAVPADN
jgi:hypothetical protein